MADSDTKETGPPQPQPQPVELTGTDAAASIQEPVKKHKKRKVVQYKGIVSVLFVI
jgi:hypothetical protein